MNFDLTEDQEMLKAVAERFVTDRYDVERRRQYLDEAGGFGAENWSLLGELGIIAAPFDEALGGLDLDATGVAVVYEALGRGLFVEPLIENALMAGRVFAAIADEAQRTKWMDAILSGEKRLAMAHAERGSRNGSLCVRTRADVSGKDATLCGHKPFVVAGFNADAYIVSARHDGGPSDASGWAFYLVPADARGLTVKPWRMADGSMAATLDFDETPAIVLDAGENAADVLTSVETLVSLARSAEMLGIMERMFADTLDYLRTREQFDQPIGKFQAIQHRMAAQYAILTQARALVELAVVKEAKPEFAKAVDGARAFIAGHALEMGHEMIQFHGGMGITDELALGFGHKRLLVLSRWPDDADTALDRYIDAA
ncbi:acyl-CoA dehydrogenase family protein [Croceicoccus hydrothermalis]|uniref:acyl-CoA dehydrogenase family protein n=1 Tax=Croceicoccus hydrothermalis TaxID=2867964 RepID=UPI001EFB6712